MDSVPPETPIRDVVDRCRVWESHADPEIRRVSKPSPDPIYPAYVVGEHVAETLRVVAVTKPKSPPDQLEDLLRRLLANMAAPVPVPAPVPEVPTVEKLMQRLVAETQGRQLAAVRPPEPVGLGNLVRSYLSGQQTLGTQIRQRPIRRDWNGVVCFSCGKSGHAATHCPALDELSPFMLLGWRAESTPGGFIMISPRVAAERSQTATDPGEGFATRISSNVRPQDPGGGAQTMAAPRGLMNIEVTGSPRCPLGNLRRYPRRFGWCWSRRPILGTPILE